MSWIKDTAQSAFGIGLIVSGLLWIMITLPGRFEEYYAYTATDTELGVCAMLILLGVCMIISDSLSKGGSSRKEKE